MAEQLVRDFLIEAALQIKIKATLAHNNQSYVQFCASSYYDRNKNKVKLTVKYDMGCKKRSHGRRYKSSSGHTFIISGKYKGVIDVVLFSKAYLKCDATDNMGE